MKQNVLFIVHVEEVFRQFFPDQLFVHRILKAAAAKKYSRTFFMESGVDSDGLAFPLETEIPQNNRIDWGWGYSPDMFDDEEQQWVISALGHEYTWVPPEIREMLPLLQNANIYIGGGYESECFQDFCDVLDHLNLSYTKVKGYIY